MRLKDRTEACPKCRRRTVPYGDRLARGRRARLLHYWCDYCGIRWSGRWAA